MRDSAYSRLSYSSAVYNSLTDKISCLGIAVNVGLETFRLGFDSHQRSLASKSLAHCVLRSTWPPTLSGTKMSIVAYIRDENLMWLIRAVVYLLAALRDHLFADVGNGWPHSALRYH